MRRGLSLVELIFSMVIIAIAFTLFPKIMQDSAKSANKMLQEEAMYNGVALIGLIKNLPWDEQNSRYDDILLVQTHDSYDCNESLGTGKRIYRQGGFVGSRNCEHKVEASSIGSDGEAVPDDIDDFDGYSTVATNRYGKRAYRLEANVSYRADAMPGSTQMMGTKRAQSTNTKYIRVSVTPIKMTDTFKNRLSFWYLSSNIGQLHINKIPWEH